MFYAEIKRENLVHIVRQQDGKNKKGCEDIVFVIQYFTFILTGGFIYLFYFILFYS